MFEFREVRAELLRPTQLRLRREKADVAFLPLGALEWHGVQNPIGVDYLTSHHACCRAAQMIEGGVVFPPLIWGLPRDSFFMEQNESVTEPAARAYGTSAGVVKGVTAHGGMDIQTQWQHYQLLIRMAMEQIAGFGFRSIYVAAGHAPLVHYAHPVCVAFSRARQMAGQPITTDFGGAYDAAGLKCDHAGKIETSAMLALDPPLADIGELERQPQYLGVGSGADATDATVTLGREWLEGCAAGIAKEARWLVENYPALPPRHGHLRTMR